MNSLVSLHAHECMTACKTFVQMRRSLEKVRKLVAVKHVEQNQVLRTGAMPSLSCMVSMGENGW